MGRRMTLERHGFGSLESCIGPRLTILAKMKHFVLELLCTDNAAVLGMNLNWDELPWLPGERRPRDVSITHQRVS